MYRMDCVFAFYYGYDLFWFEVLLGIDFSFYCNIGQKKLNAGNECVDVLKGILFDELQVWDLASTFVVKLAKMNIFKSLLK